MDLFLIRHATAADISPVQLTISTCWPCSGTWGSSSVVMTANLTCALRSTCSMWSAEPVTTTTSA